MLVNRLPTIMEQQQVSIRELSRRTGITYTTIRAIYHSERRSVQLKVLEAICRALNVQPGDIFKVMAESEVYVEPEALKSPGGPASRGSDQPSRPPDQTDGWRSW